MHIPIEERRGLLVLLESRQFSGTNAGNSSDLGSGNASGGGGNMKLIIISISCLLTFIVLVVIYSILRHLRLQQKSSRYVPTTFLKRKWDHWNPSSVYTPAQSYDGVDTQSPTARRRPGRTPGHTPVSSNTGRTDTATVDRNTSVRSVMTLPAYRPNPREDERVLGREGERAGIDMVVEFPETLEEEEARREEEMDTLYQVRLARRAEIAERQERARLRREARDRGDWATYEALRAASRQRAASSNSGTPAAGSSTTSLATTLVTADATHRDRDRRVPSVSYAAVGLARHDGTRVRANSSESERPLLSSASSIGGQTTPLHGRAASLLSVSTTASTEDNNTPSVTEVIQLGARTPTRSQHLEADVGEQSIPVDPPRYDDFSPAPPYESPVRTRAPFLPLPATSLPAIEVTGTTPGTSREPSPVGWGTVGGRAR
ncbi:MAG: hypothetical protein M1839_007370 [Geoglossum umbratile]|nr:MAG: hypothetical protein M1839_007370 [Geoglossum umbratile]